MKTKKNKLSSFSLSELLVTLIITILSMSFALFCLQYIQEKFVQFKVSLEHIQAISQFERFVWKDIHHYPHTALILADSSFVFTHPFKTIEYDIKQKKIYREEQLILDEYDSINFYHSGHLITKGRFDAIAIYLTPDQRSLMYFFSLPKSVQLYLPQ